MFVARIIFAELVGAGAVALNVFWVLTLTVCAVTIHLLRTIFCDSGHMQNERERPDMKRKYINTTKAQGKESELTTLISEVGGGTNIQRKLTHVVRCKL